ncbi:MAG: SDR family NAD(P)-dependent oxidoreductase [Proteobacteria bacterium]|nr:SDR family NAD(P)-dependent oxidoreductase [Pseudomonadota bacterium]
MIDGVSTSMEWSGPSASSGVHEPVQPIAIIGMACRFPGAPDYDTLWANLARGIDSVTEVPRSRWDWTAFFGNPALDPSKTNSKWGGFIDGVDVFDPLFFRISPTEARYLDPQQRLALQTAWQVIEDAGYRASALSGKKIGVYVGVSKNDYAELMRENGVPIASHVSTGTVHSIIANRISYILDLRGKSEVVDTACSSALVALHNAVRDIRQGECESALVGAVNALLSPTMYVSHGQSGMLSPRGRCKTFDRAADGYVRGEGVGFVFIKPLDAARRDRDNIIGVIRGTAVNHGGRANTLTSPTVEGQAEVIRLAHEDAHISPASITYVEAHGTGTPLGDPIEILALSRAFATTEPSHRCGIGSIKTNIGHLESASGMAGLVKILLCLRHRQLAGQLHFTELNPHIDLDKSPFYVVDRLQPWPHTTVDGASVPLRAGLSAFGMGGVNAHVVIEEPPTARLADRSDTAHDGPQLVPLSAKTKTALANQVQRLRAFVDAHQPHLCDVAYTLQTGRQSMTYRAAFVARNASHLSDLLAAFAAGHQDGNPSIYSGKATGRPARPATQASSDLYQTAAMWVQGGVLDCGDGPGQRIPLPHYPFDQRRCWFDARSSPTTASGPGAVSKRAGQGATGSAKNSITVNRDDYIVRDHVVRGVCMVPGAAYVELARALGGLASGSAAVLRDIYWLKPLTVTSTAVVELRRDDRSPARLTLTSAGVDHFSAVIGPPQHGAEPFVDLAAIRSRCQRRVDAQDLYHRFRSYGLAYGSTFRVIDHALLGAGEIVCQLKRRPDVAASAQGGWEPSMLDGVLQSVVALELLTRDVVAQPHSGPAQPQYVPYQLGELAVFAEVPDQCFAHVRRTRDQGVAKQTFDMSLCTSQGRVVVAFRDFAKRPLASSPAPAVVDTRAGTGDVHASQAEQRSSQAEQLSADPSAVLFYTTGLVDQPLTMHRETPTGLMVLSAQRALVAALGEAVAIEHVVEVRPSTGFAKIARNCYSVGPGDRQSWQRVFTASAEHGIRVDTIVFDALGADETLDDIIAGCAQAVLALTQTSIADRTLADVRIFYAYLDDGSAAACAHQMMGGFARTLAYENPAVSLTTVGLDKNSLGSAATILAEEIGHHAHPPLAEVVYADRRRMVRTASKLPTIRAHEAEFDLLATARSAPGCAYVITGGAGQLGRVFARYFAQQHRATIVMLGRSPRSEEIDRFIATLEDLGGGGMYVQADVGVRDDVAGVFDELRRLGEGLKVRGIIHAAGFIEDAFIVNKTGDSFARVVAPKLHGLVWLDEITRDLPLQFFVAFSSIAALLPNQGQCDYAAANSFVDAYMRRRNALRAAGQRHGMSLAVNWPLWAEGGIGVTPQQEEHLTAEFGMRAMENQVGVAVLRSLLQHCANHGLDHCVAVEGDEDKLARRLHIGEPGIEPASATSAASSAGEVAEMLGQLIDQNRKPGPEEPDEDATFAELGLDSVDLVTLASELTTAFGFALKPPIFFEHQTPRALTAFLVARAARVRTAGSDRGRQSLLDRELDKRGSASGSGRTWQKTLYNDEFFMRDHVVAGEYNVPGACFVEIALQAAQSAAGATIPYRLTNSYWVRKLSSSGAPITMTVVVEGKDDHFEYEILDRSSGWDVVHAVGEVHGATPGEVSALDLGRIEPAAIRARCSLVRASEAIYAQIIAEGLHVGRSFMPMIDVALSEDEALAQLRLPRPITATHADYTLHPTLLTGVLQTALLNNKPHGAGHSKYIPMAIDEIVFSEPIPAECYVHSTPHSANLDNTDIRKFDARIADAQGRVVAVASGISLRRIEGKSEPQAIRTAEPVSGPGPQPPVTSVVGPEIDREQVENLLKELCADAIGLAPGEIDADVEFEHFGIDSIMVFQLNRRLQAAFGSLSKTLFFEYRNFEELAQYLLDSQRPTLAQLIAENAAATDLAAAAPAAAAAGAGPAASPVATPAAAKAGAADPRPRQEADQIAIIGAAGRYPGAANLDEFWSLLIEGRDCIGELPAQRFGSDPVPARWGGFIDDVDCFDPMFFAISPRQAELLDPQERLFLEVVWHTLENAGYTRARLAASSRRVGVFVGALWQPYVELGAQQTERGNTLGPSGLLYNIPNRVSYFFDWVGPSLAIDTACSSSLTALHYACASAQCGDSDSAIVGGVNLSLSAGKYHFLSDNGFLSSDGRCRSFGAGGDGYVPGEGVGAILIKRVRDAERDGDRILAVVKATSVNHGGKTHGFTVPNPNQQAVLIGEALNRGNVHPRAVSYVEAHGTGTALGDPIELTGLRKAFAEKTQDRQFCSIGSVKSNIGHLEAAAGIAGLTKILLQLQHATLAPSLHADPPNPNIDFEDSPFVVQRQAASWSRPEVDIGRGLAVQPRTAMISSFGAGGSNAHAIIAEYAAGHEGRARGADHPSAKAATVAQVVPISARTPAALLRAAAQMAEYLASLSPQAGPEVADVAHTLQVGREAFDHRVAFVAETLADLARAVQLFASGQSPGQSSVQVFQGQLDDRANDRASLSQMMDDDDLRSMALVWAEKRKPAAIARAWSLGMTVEWSQLWAGQHRPMVALPGYPFEKQRFWLPGFRDARPDRSPTSGSARLHPLVHRNVSTLAACAFESQFTDSEVVFDHHRLNGRGLLPAVAHMAMAAAAARFALSGHDEPAGRPASDICGVDNVVWSAPLLAPLNADDGAITVRITLASVADHIEFAIAKRPDQTRQTPCSKGRIVVARRAAPAALDLDQIEARITETVSGDQFYRRLDACGLHLGPAMRSIRHVGVVNDGALARVELPSASAAYAGLELHPALFDAVFQVAGHLCVNASADQPDDRQLKIPFALKNATFFAPIPDRCVALVTRRRPDQGPALSPDVMRFDAYVADTSGRIVLQIEDVAMRAASMPEDERAERRPTVRSDKLICAVPVWRPVPLGASAPAGAPPKATVITAGFADCIHAGPGHRGVELFDLGPLAGHDHAEAVEALIREVSTRMDSAVRSGASRRVVVAVPERLRVVGAAMSGMLRSIRLEHPRILPKVVVVADHSSQTRIRWQDLVDRELSEAVFSDVQVHYPDPDTRLVKAWQEEALGAMAADWLEPGGVYWIAGGFGALGRLMSVYIAQHAPGARLFLTGRSPLSGPAEEFMARLAGLGATPVHVRLRLEELAEVTELVAGIERDHGGLKGVVHAAGVTRDSLFTAKTTSQVAAVLAAKVRGTLNIDRATGDQALDFMCLFSSISGVAGNIGQTDYAAANAFMDAFAAERQNMVEAGRRSGTTIAIDWPLWADGGMQVASHDLARLERHLGIQPMPSGVALDAVSRIVALRRPHVLIGYGNAAALRDNLHSDFQPRRRGVTDTPADRARSTEDMSTRPGRADATAQLITQLKDILADITKMRSEDISARVSMSEYGVESIALAQFAAELNDTFAIDLVPTFFFEYTTLSAVAGYLADHLGDSPTDRYAAVAPAHATTAAPAHATTAAPVHATTAAPVHATTAAPINPTDLSTAKDNDEAIAIIGMSGTLPGSPTLDDLWAHLHGGHDLITEVPAERWDWREYYGDPHEGGSRMRAKWGGFIDGMDCFDASFFRISPREAAYMDPQQRKLLECVWNCFEDAGYRPSAFAGSRTGLFVGVTGVDYYELLARSRADVQAHTTTGNTSSVIANRISYLLDLRGPSEPVDTACSSSLVAIDHAVRAVRDGRCEAAVVGGVNALLSPTFSLAFSKAGMLSPDGRSKSFDASANGYVRGEGVAAILLKPVSRAEADGDHMYGLIRSTSVNHNGRSQSMTAPSAQAQAEMLVDAYQSAGIDPRTVGYIEAHGTGTSLGDPIEIDGLKRAFSKLYEEWGGDAPGQAHCGIGSVKSNIGHLEPAAGIAGVLKVLLAFRHRLLPPTLHLREQNPYIDLAGSPFYFVRQVTPWSAPLSSSGAGGVLPRRAGVNSFGFGGVNAHVVLEEYIPKPASPPPIQDPVAPGEGARTVVVLSAQTEQQLRARAAALRSFLDRVPAADLARVGYTLQAGREEMPHRVAFVTRDLEQLWAQLDSFERGVGDVSGCFVGTVACEGQVGDPGCDSDMVAASVDPDWLASDRADHGRRLDRLAAAWVAGALIEWAQLYPHGVPQRISLPGYDFARTRHWVPDIPRPSDMLVDGSNTRVDRSDASGQLDASDARVGTSVRLCLDPQDPNRYTDQLTDDQFYLDQHRLLGKCILPGVAYLEMARVAGSELGRGRVGALGEVNWLQPLWVGPEGTEVALVFEPGARNGAAQLGFTVSSQAVGEGDARVNSRGHVLFDPPGAAPRIDIAAIRKRCPDVVSGQRLYRHLARGGYQYGPRFQCFVGGQCGDREVLAEVRAMGSETENGRSGDFLDLGVMDAAVIASAALLMRDLPEDASHIPFAVRKVLFHGPTPERGLIYLARTDDGSAGSNSTFDVAIADRRGVVRIQLEGLELRQYTRSQARDGGNSPASSHPAPPAADDRAPDAVTYSIVQWRDQPARPGAAAASLALFATDSLQRMAAAHRGSGLDTAQTLSHQRSSGTAGCADAAQAAFCSVLDTVRHVLGQRMPGNKRILVFATEDDALLVAPIVGLFKTAALENPAIQGRVVTIAGMRDISDSMLAHIVATETAAAHAPVEIRYLADGQRQGREICAAAESRGQASQTLRRGGVYWITGGAGGLGTIVARYLGQVSRGPVILSGRRSPGPDIASAIAALRRDGVDAHYLPADVASGPDVADLVAAISTRFGGLHGIIHAAGVLSDGLIPGHSSDDVATVFAPKVHGAETIDWATRAQPLDFVVLFSSVAAAVGNVGQASYAGANAFLDAFADHRNALVQTGERSGVTWSIAWPLWLDGGMQIGPGESARHASDPTTAGLIPITAEQGIDAFAHLLDTEPGHAMAGGHRIVTARPLAAPTPAPVPEVEHRQPAPYNGVDAHMLDTHAQALLRSAVGEVVGMPAEELDIGMNLARYGVDSIMQIQIISKLQRAVAGLSKTLLFEYTTIADITAYLADSHRDELIQYFGLGGDDPTASAGSRSGDDAPLQPDNPRPPCAVVDIRTGRDRDPVVAIDGTDGRAPTAGSTGSSTDIAVIGMSGLFASAANLDQWWDNLVGHRDVIREIPADRFDYRPWFRATARPATDLSSDSEAMYAKWGSFIDDVAAFDEGFFGISPREARWMDPQVRLLLQSIYHTSEDAGYASQMRGSDAGVFVGVCFRDYLDVIDKLDDPMNPYLGTGNSLAGVANRISFVFDLTGPSMPIDTACSSSLFALEAAVAAIERGACSTAFVAGANLILSPFRHRYFSSIGALSPTGRCHSFDAAADGYVPGEAIVSVLLKPLSRARADGDRIHGVIRGIAAGHGGYTPSLTAPSVDGEARVVTRAWRDADLDPSTLGYIEAHGTGTPLGDPIEIRALTRALQTFNSRPKECLVGTAKAHVGHTEGAAGLTGLVKVLLQMRHQLIPAMPGFRQLNPDIELADSGLQINREATAWPASAVPRRAGVSSFGFSGAYAHVVVEDHVPGRAGHHTSTRGPAQPAVYRAGEPEAWLVPLSAQTTAALGQLADNLAEFVRSHDCDIGDVAFTLQVGREAFAHRSAFVGRDRQALLGFLDRLGRHCARSTAHPDDSRSQPIIAHVAATPRPPTAHEERSIERADLDRVATLWLDGVDIAWAVMHAGARRTRLHLPGYPFAGNRHWLEPAIGAPDRASAGDRDSSSAGPQNGSSNRVAAVVGFVQKHLATATEIPASRLDVDADITSFGFDSMVVAHLVAQLEAVTGERDPAIFFSSRSIRQVAQRICQRYGDRIPSPAWGSEDCVMAANAAPSPDTGPASAARNSEVSPETRRAAGPADVAVIGLAGRYPNADGVLAFADILAAGRDCIERIPSSRWAYANASADDGGTAGRWGGFIARVREFDYDNFNMSLRQALVAHPEERLLLEETWHCLESAGYDPTGWIAGPGVEVGVYIGASFHDYQFVVSEAASGTVRDLPYTSQTFTYANRLSYFYNLRGPSTTIDTACSSSLYAIYEAYNAITNGICDMAIAGGVALNLHRSKYDFLDDLNFLARDGRCRAFADGGTGYVPGEGVGVVLLKSLGRARRDNDNILAVIKGAAAGNDGRTNGFTVPNPDAQRDIILRAMDQAKVSADTISLVECHGTGTALGDPIEIAALTEAYRTHTSDTGFCAISSVKSNIGHLEAAAGIAQLSKVIVQLRRKMLFANVMHGSQLNPDIEFDRTPFRVQQSPAAWPLADGRSTRRAGISSFGAGGTNVHLIVEEFDEPPQRLGTAAERDWFIVPLSADSEAQLRAMVEGIGAFLHGDLCRAFNRELTVADIAATLQHGRAHKPWRLAMVCQNSLSGLGQELQAALRICAGDDRDSGSRRIVTGHAAHGASDATDGRGRSATDLVAAARGWVTGATGQFRGGTGHRRRFLPGYVFNALAVDVGEYVGNDSAATAPVPASGPGPVDGATALDHAARVRHTLASVLGALPSSFTDDMEFSDCGIDSITASRIHNALIKHYPSLDPFALFEFSSVARLAAHLDTLDPSPAAAGAPDQPDVTAVNRPEQIGDIRSLEFGTERIAMERYLEAYRAWPKRKADIVARSVDVRGRRLEIVVSGSGPTVVLLPPFNCTAIIWIQQILALSDKFRVVVPHYPGLGGSDWVAGLTSFDDLAHVITAAIDALVADSTLTSPNANWVGWSFGGFLAQAIAAERPEYVAKLVLLSTTSISWSSPEYTISGEEFAQTCAHEFAQNYPKLPGFLKKMPEFVDLRRRGCVERFVVGTSERKVMDRYFLMIAKFQHLDVASRLTVPTYLMSGEWDELMPARFARRLAEHIDNSVYFEVEGGHHFLGLFEKDVVNKKLRKWLKKPIRARPKRAS